MSQIIDLLAIYGGIVVVFGVLAAAAHALTTEAGELTLTAIIALFIIVSLVALIYKIATIVI